MESKTAEVEGRSAPTGSVPIGLVGRDSELRLLQSALESAGSGSGGVALLSGEPGIGKTRLADVLADHARANGAVVLWGRTWEAGGAPSYWPWTMALRSHLRSVGPVDFVDVGPGAAALVDVVPELAAALPPTTSSPAADPATARFELFEAVTGVLRALADDRPLLIVLDDVHAADTPSLLLLQYLAGQLSGSRILLVAAYRDVELDRTHPLRGVLADVVRSPSTIRVPLMGLADTNVADIIRAVTGETPSPAVVAAVHRETDGNPLFVTEMVRLAAAEGRLHETDPAYWERVVPESVREVIGLRVNRLSRECGHTLSLASILGREFDLELLQQLSELHGDDLADVLDEGSSANLVVDVPGSPSRLRFSHALVRDALYEELPPARRARLHLRAAEAMQAIGLDQRDQHLTEYAHHLFQAGTNAATDTTVAALRRAAHRALTLFAYEEATRLQRMALAVLDGAGPGSGDARADLLLALGDASARAGNLGSAQASYLDAAELGRAGRPDVLARAAMGYGGRFVWSRAGEDHRVISLLEEALVALDAGPSELRVRLLARLAGASRDDPDISGRDRLSAEAVDQAKQLGDPAALAYALAGRGAAVMEGPLPAVDPPFVPRELVDAATSAGDRELLFEGRQHEFVACLASGDTAGAERALHHLSELAQSLRQPAQLWLVRTVTASLQLLRGELDAVEAALLDNERDSHHAALWESGAFIDAQRFILARERGRLAEAQPLVERDALQFPARPVFRCALALLHAELGHPAAARRILHEVVDAEACRIPRNNDWSLSVTLVAEAVARLGLTGPAAVLHDLLLPAADRYVDTLEAPIGSLARPLGLVAATTGDLDAAVSHLGTAVEANRQAGARPWQGRAAAALGMVLLRRARPGDADRAAAVLEEAAKIATVIGQQAVLSEIAVVHPGGGRFATIPPPSSEAPTVPAAVGPSGARTGTLRREGEYWLVELDGRASRLRHMKGFDYLARLLAAAGTELHVLELATPRAPTSRAAERDEVGTSSGHGAADVLLDDDARRAYKQRIADLRAEIDQAEEWNDPARAEAAQRELDFIARELAAATGLGGRARMAASDAERARVNVTRALRSAIARIAEADPRVGGHLQQAVRTGAFCSYEADPIAPVEWIL